MKKVILMSLFAAVSVASKAQTVVADSVSTGASYKNNAWYSLENGFVDTTSATNWDIAFAATASMTNPLTTSILVNTKVDTLYEATGIAIADFATLTLPNPSWTKLYNSDTTWAIGAFKQTTPTGQLDYGWGSYNTTTHDLEANRIFVLKYGTTYKKLYITLNSVNARYIFTYANLDNTGLHTDTLNVNNYSTKNFIYYSIKGDSVIDREPVKASWDFLFTQYFSTYGNTPNQQVTGVLQNTDVKVAQADQVADTITNYGSFTFSNHINIIGSDWKTVNMVTFGWDVTDSLVYFVQTANKDIWKVMFTKFGGAANGTYFFTKEKLYTYTAPDTGTAVANVTKSAISVAAYPNPVVAGKNVTVVYSNDVKASAATVAVYDMAGRTVLVENLNTQTGLYQHNISTNGLRAGIYIVNVTIDGSHVQQKLVIQ